MKSPTEITKDELFEDSFVQELFAITDTIKRESLINKYLAKAKEIGCLGQFESFIKEVRKAFNKAQKDALRRKGYGGEQDIEYSDFQYPALQNIEYNVSGWVANENGIFARPGEGRLLQICYHPIAPVEILTNIEDGKQRVKLAFKERGKWREIMIPRSTIASKSKIVDLANVGVNVTSESAKWLVQFLSEVEYLNQDIIRLGRSTSKLGWTENGDFIPFDQSEIQFDAFERFSTLVKAITEKGSEDKWYDFAKKVRKGGRKEPNIYLIASLASPLLKPLNLLPFFVNLWTDTGRGKTVALMLAASVWGNPGEGQYLTDPTSTKVAFEQRCQVLNNLPLMIDDLSKMNSGNMEEFCDTIYFLCGGKGKDRSDIALGLTTSSTWKNIILTNMERPLANETMRGGAINRILDIECDEGSFFMEGKRDKGKDVVELVKNNYGFAGRHFVDAIKNYSIEDLKSRHSHYIDLIKEEADRQNSVKEEKQISPMALLLLTDEIAEECLFKDGIRLDIEWAVRQLKSCEEVSEHQRAYDTLMDVVIQNGHLHFNSQCPGDKWGYIENDMVYLFPTALKELSKKHNFSTTGLAEWAKRKGLLVYDTGKNQKTKNFLGAINKFYVFKMPKLEEVQDNDPMPFD